MGILGKLLVSKLVVGKVVSIGNQQTDRQTNRRTDRFRSLLYRYTISYKTILLVRGTAGTHVRQGLVIASQGGKLIEICGAQGPGH